MRKLRVLAALVPLAAAVGLAAPAAASTLGAESGSFSVLSYNIAGLPFP
ncbi:hypothetical protein [Promicromonospora soli]